jgi:hypothetical protein
MRRPASILRRVNESTLFACPSTGSSSWRAVESRWLSAPLHALFKGVVSPPLALALFASMPQPSQDEEGSSPLINGRWRVDCRFTPIPSSSSIASACRQSLSNAMPSTLASVHCCGPRRQAPIDHRRDRLDFSTGRISLVKTLLMP